MRAKVPSLPRRLTPHRCSPWGGAQRDTWAVIREPQHVEATLWTVLGVSVNVINADIRLGTLASSWPLACVALLRVSGRICGFAVLVYPVLAPILTRSGQPSAAASYCIYFVAVCCVVRCEPTRLMVYQSQGYASDYETLRQRPLIGLAEL